MNSDRKRIVEVRLIVIALIDITEPSLTEALVAGDANSSSIARVVASEVSSNLSSVPYVDMAIVSSL